MADYLLDTNHASPLVTLHHPLRKRVFEAMQAGHKFNDCVPVLSEVWYGISALPRAIKTAPSGDKSAKLSLAFRLMRRMLKWQPNCKFRCGCKAINWKQLML